MNCPCGSGRPFDGCCGPILAGTPAPTAEALMRSRFTAFSLGDVAHLERSWAPETRPANVTVDPDQRWVRLEVIDTVKGRQLDTDGVVEFRGHFERHHAFDNDGRRRPGTHLAAFIAGLVGLLGCHTD